MTGQSLTVSFSPAFKKLAKSPSCFSNPPWWVLRKKWTITNRLLCDVKVVKLVLSWWISASLNSKYYRNFLGFMTESKPSVSVGLTHLEMKKSCACGVYFPCVVLHLSELSISKYWIDQRGDFVSAQPLSSLAAMTSCTVWLEFSGQKTFPCSLYGCRSNVDHWLSEMYTYFECYGFSGCKIISNRYYFSLSKSNKILEHILIFRIVKQ